jgi:hypothetical protein
MLVIVEYETGILPQRVGSRVSTICEEQHVST